MNTELTLHDTLEQLAAEEYDLPDDYENAAIGLSIKKKKPGSPWYVRFFVGLSAWIATIFFIAFLFASNILQAEEGGIIFGLVFCSIAIGLNRLAPRDDFLEQLGLVLSMAGQLLFLIGLLTHYKTPPTALGMIVLEIVLLWAYQDRLHRIISTLIIPGALLAVIFDFRSMEAIHILVFMLGAGIVALQYKKNVLLIAGVEELAQPITYGIGIFLLGMLVLPLVDEFDVRWWITAVLLAVILLFLVALILMDLEISLRSDVSLWLLAGCAALLIPAIRTPGILAALIILLLGFWRNTRLLIGLAAMFLLFYLGAYYYSLEWALLVKSFALVSTGIILFLIRYIVLKFAHGGVQ